MRGIHLDQHYRYTPDQVINTITGAIRKFDFHGVLLDKDNVELKNFRRPGLLGTRLEDGSYVSRRGGLSPTVVADRVDTDGNVTKVAVDLTNVADMLYKGDLVMKHSHGHALRTAEQQLRSALKDDPDLEAKMSIIVAKDIERRTELMRLTFAAADFNVDMDLETFKIVALWERPELRKAVQSLERGGGLPAAEYYEPLPMHR